MRKLIIPMLMAATLIPATGAIAQSAGEVRRSERELREQRQDLRQAQRYGTRADVREERRDVREARREVREDWRDYRQSNRNVFRGGRYVGPLGYAYRPLRSGAVLAPSYYGQRYLIADPYRYRLPRVSGPLRWVRYGNDVVLLDTRSGRVITVYDRFFW